MFVLYARKQKQFWNIILGLSVNQSRDNHVRVLKRARLKLKNQESLSLHTLSVARAIYFVTRVKKSAKTDVRVSCYISLKISGCAHRPNANNLCFVTMVTEWNNLKAFAEWKINLRQVGHVDTSRNGKIALITIMLFSERLDASLAQKWRARTFLRVFAYFLDFSLVTFWFEH